MTFSTRSLKNLHKVFGPAQKTANLNVAFNWFVNLQLKNVVLENTPGKL